MYALVVGLSGSHRKKEAVQMRIILGPVLGVWGLGFGVEASEIARIWGGGSTSWLKIGSGI